MKAPLHSIRPRKPPARRGARAEAEREAAPAEEIRLSAFPVVGLGASAGGLEALQLFFGAVPADCGLAFVVVQHLDPTHKGILVELLQKTTRMLVAEVTDRVRVEPGHVYVIPPNKDLSILHGALHLLAPAAPRGLRLPIDFFLRSLADDRLDRSVAVILSGMGSDGTLGLRAIKERAGAVFVQDPATAKFDGMPRSAIDAGLADVVAPAEALPERILAYLKHRPAPFRGGEPLPEREDSALEKVVILLRAQTRHDFSLYKRSTIYRRIERRMGLHQLTRIADYVGYLREHPQESELLFKELLIGVTSFFRDASVWEQLKTEVIPALLTARPLGGVLRAWTAGCSTGEEAYTLAMVFQEALEIARPEQRFTLQIFATDLDHDAIVKARQGSFPTNIAADVSEERLRRFFTLGDHGYQVRKEIREMVIFAPQNLVMDPPFTKLDLLTCRNLLIYFDAALQRKLLPLFHYCLNPGGVLVLGSSESIGHATELFDSFPGKTRLFRRLDQPARAGQLDFPSAFTRIQKAHATSADPKAAGEGPNLQQLADHLLLQRFSPAAVLVTAGGDILYISGKTGKFLEPAAGKANWNLFAMARPGLGAALGEAFHQAVRKGKEVLLPGVRVGTEGATQSVDVVLSPLTEPEMLRGLVMVVFREVKGVAPEPPGRKRRLTGAAAARLEELEQELHQARVESQSLREEVQTSQEELRSASEEMQSTNEEIQSTNEELTTSKEEMQSMNEELQTVNHELQAKVDELSEASNDMKNLLNSTGIATLFLDEALQVRRFTPTVTSIIKLIPGDAGRPLSDIVTELQYPELASDAHGVLRTLIFVEREVRARDGRWFTVRILPYRTQDNRIVGVVMTFHDITTNKTLEAELRKAQAALQLRVTDQTESPGAAKEARAADQPTTDLPASSVPLSSS